MATQSVRIHDEGFERRALVLQGGGALGAYHIGAYRALEERGFAPNMVAGISIGSINAAIIAGNEPRDRLARLREFWHEISWPDVGQYIPMSPAMREMYNLGSAVRAMTFGQPNFFRPRAVSPYLAPPGLPEATSVYDTAELRATLLRLVDFDRINRNKPDVRLLLGAVKVETGELVFFDSDTQSASHQWIGPEHVMASGGFPPGLPGARIDGELYWDGGCVSNTPIDGVLHATPRVDTLIFMVDLFDPHGREPQTMDEVLLRQKEIQYASRSTYHIEETTTRRNLRRALQHALEKVPQQEKLGDPVLREAMAEVDEKVHAPQARTEIVHIIAHPAPSDLSSQDYEFSRVSIDDRATAGYEDMKRAIALHPWTTDRAAYASTQAHTLRGVHARPSREAIPVP